MSNSQSPSPSQRPLAPAGGDIMLNEDPPEPSASNATSVTKKNPSIACEGCKVLKRKCDRNQPCSNCQGSGKECVYDPLQDGRRKEVRKRRLEELEIRSQALEKLLVTLRTSSSADARLLLELIRRDAPLQEILQFMDAHPGEVSNRARAALSASPPPEGTGIRRMLTINELVDKPAFSVPAAPWTKITHNDWVVSHLVSAYLNWYHFYYHNFDEVLFLEAMVSGDLESSYCSPLLVNAVLAMGCMFTDHPFVFATPEDPSTRGLHFYNEAHRLWSLEAARPTLTNIQGFTIMIMVAAFIGKDRVSTTSLKHLEIMVPQLLRQHKKSTQSQPISQDFQKSLAIIEWAAHIYVTGFGTGMLTPPTSPKPLVEAPFVSQGWSSHLTRWSPYPAAGEPIELPLHKLYHYMCELYLVASDIQSLVFAEFPKMSIVEKGEEAQAMDSRVLKWYKSLPLQFQTDDPDFVLAPTTVDIALSMHHFRMIMWYWAISPPNTSSDPTSRSADTRSKSNSTSKSLNTATAMCLDLAATIADLSQKFDSRYGPSFFSILMPQSGILAASFLLSGNLNSTREEEILLQIMRTLVQSARRWQLVRGVTHMLLVTAKDKIVPVGEHAKGGVTPALYQELKVMVKDLAWNASEHVHFSSQYPNHISIKEDPTLEMSDLLERWAEMAIDEKDATPVPDETQRVEASNKGKYKAV